MFYTSITMFIQLFTTMKVGEPVNRKKLSRRSLAKITNKTNLIKEITGQYEATLDHYGSVLDTKPIVEEENIPIDEWIKKPDDKKEKKSSDDSIENKAQQVSLVDENSKNKLK